MIDFIVVSSSRFLHSTTQGRNIEQKRERLRTDQCRSPRAEQRRSDASDEMGAVLTLPKRTGSAGNEAEGQDTPKTASIAGAVFPCCR
jgi:hypothetical protein